MNQVSWLQLFFLIIVTYSAAHAHKVLLCDGGTLISSDPHQTVQSCEERANWDFGGRYDAGCCANNYNPGDGYAVPSWYFKRDKLEGHKKNPCPFCFGLVKEC